MIIVCTNHKTGTYLMKNVFSTFALKANIPFIGMRKPKKPDNSIIFVNHSCHINRYINLKKYTYKGIHIIRHPYEIIMSATRYHQITDEYWCNQPRSDLKDKTYKQHLKDLSMDEKILFEMENSSKNVINGIYHWDWHDPNFLVLKLEDIQDYPEDMAKIICNFLSIDNNIFEPILCNIVKRKNTTSHCTNKTNDRYTYKKYFKKVHYDRIKEIFPDDLLDVFDYEI